MQSILVRIESQVSKALERSFGGLPTLEAGLLRPDVVLSTQPRFGHYQCNNALKLAKALKKNPREIAGQLLAALEESGGSMIHKMEIAGPGFINLTLDTKFLSSEIESLLKDSHCGVPLPEKRKRMIVEFSSPNIAKELHVGHLRSTIIGDALARLFEFLGHDVLRLNHVGDWGTQFGMLIAYLQEEEPAVLTGEKRANLSELMGWYRASKKRFDERPEFKKAAQLQVVRLQGGDEASLEAWEMICDISREAFREIYGLLDIKITERGESYYNPFLPEVIADLEDKGLVTISEGAKCVFLEGFIARDGSPLPMIVQKSDGGYNYATTDIAAMRHRTEVERAERIIVVTDAGQSLHFQMVDALCKKAGYLTTAVQFDHVLFGVVLGPDGKKFKTRSGETEKLIDLILEAIKGAKAIFKERLPDGSPEEIEELGTILGVDAIKYADLCSHRIKDYLFSYERMLRFEGNTAAFLLYAFVRIQGIERKVGKPIPLEGKVQLEEPSEIALALHLRQFGETLESMGRDLLPNRLTEYLYELAEKFHAFFRDCRVEGSDREESRLMVAEATRRILKQGLTILGLKTLPRM
ncbi:MAG: Arginine--tRNA ligase [Chlamydiae bacterium]|nr:Arginine--tRNA ligase [Chlamydiota bacterium]